MTQFDQSPNFNGPVVVRNLKVFLPSTKDVRDANINRSNSDSEGVVFPHIGNTNFPQIEMNGGAT